MRSTLVVGMIVVGIAGVARADDPPTYECHAPAADKALEAYTKIRDAKKLEVQIVRRGKPVMLVFTIK